MADELKIDPIARRDAMRSTIFASRNVESELVTLAGEEIEIRTPSLGAVLDSREESSTKRMMARMIINYCYVPGTDQQLFESADMEMLLNMPFNREFVKLNEAIQRLTGINVDAEVKN